MPSTIPACASLMCSFKRGNIERTGFEFFGLMLVYHVCLSCVCEVIGLVDWLDRELIYVHRSDVLLSLSLTLSPRSQFHCRGNLPVFSQSRTHAACGYNYDSIPSNSNLGAGIAQWLEHRTRDWKVAGSNPCWNGGRIFFSRVDFLCWLLFRYPFHPRVTTVARKKSRSFCQKCRWQVTAKHAYTLRMWILLNRASALVTTCP